MGRAAFDFLFFSLLFVIEISWLISSLVIKKGERFLSNLSTRTDILIWFAEVILFNDWEPD
ncbi:hypothetical protein COT98_04350 [Candidatus Falkowbacteria bacterium CG10_big_fil_rev_8_21_14_0_10_39_9]|uniref:Uncharacterized protein n=1 Tax=Candidatus Falkowbacteria bacterium CG10_big_fil_rev_8_21_14_0_10_39_9 TaxID=1974566 RepID=A0A2M6WNC6_9BACT|nr:MAG: hypothetical protein COT98_04350 [Candidatus Falkowbacteria bacterium CG10_big_fil_rev_8_21_14_0_10_39_9]